MRIRPPFELAADIRQHWRAPHGEAVPGLEALATLQRWDDRYGLDDAKEVLARFRPTLRHWKGAKAQGIRDEIDAILTLLSQA